MTDQAGDQRSQERWNQGCLAQVLGRATQKQVLKGQVIYICG